MSSYPKITFGVIVLNGEPFTRHCLRALYPFAHEIIVVEGGSPGAASISTPGGHSVDGTLESLNRFKAEEDPENKVQIVTRDGFWEEKDQQSQAYAERATGDYLWQVDIDEFYKPEDMQTILAMLKDDPEITAVSFKQITFWGGFDYLTDGWYLRRGATIYHRLFKWGAGYSYVTHRPPTVHDPQKRDLRSLKWLKGYELAKRGIYLYHYSLVFPKKVLDKCAYYGASEWATHGRKAEEWAKTNYLQLHDPFRVHNVYQFPSWIERYRGTHPPEILRLKTEIESGLINIELRQNDDVKQLLSSKKYTLKRALLRFIEPLDNGWRNSNPALMILYRMKRLAMGARIFLRVCKE